jgi:hypothetical protein
METPEDQNKPKIHMGSIRKSLQTQPKILKKLSKLQINKSIETKKNLKNNMFSASKLNRSQKFVWGVTRRNFQAQPKILKLSKSTNQCYHFIKKNYVPYFKKRKEPKNLTGATRRNLQARNKIQKN